MFCHPDLTKDRGRCKPGVPGKLPVGLPCPFSSLRTEQDTLLTEIRGCEKAQISTAPSSGVLFTISISI